MDYSKPMGTPSNNQPSVPPPYQANYSDPPLYSAQPQGYGFSQPTVTSIDQHLNQHHIQQNVFIGQQQPTVVLLQESPVSDYIGYSIFTMLCCCFPLGIFALTYSIATRDANARGDRQMAELNSRRALMLNHSALGTGIGIFALAIIMIVLVFVAF
ncbi:proline-rich transmembrane protein 1-like [Poecilia latipinna]|uniref:proline-rich transmembrane protein 1-like n=1 Tax=Poecilia latipinna TaxID=48699 RepID=UPI00072E4BB7|nr:PREDICTED: proline-rich transmembrane protein 1-like [Poecilia latipinna]